MNKTIKRMLQESKEKKEFDILEKMRRAYNERIHMANKSTEKRSESEYYQVFDARPPYFLGYRPVVI